MKNKYYIGSTGFTSQESYKKYAKTIIKSLGYCIIHRDHNKYDFFCNLINNHPYKEEKIGVGIKYFSINPNPYQINSFHLTIMREDDTEIDFSYDPFKKRTLSDLMRYAIKDITIEYKRSMATQGVALESQIRGADKRNQQKLICNLCQIENLSYSEYHTDHNKVPFSKLRDNFLQITNQPTPTNFDEWIFNEEDIIFKNEWINYHNNNCDFQILCKICNLKKSNKSIS